MKIHKKKNDRNLYKPIVFCFKLVKTWSKNKKKQLKFKKTPKAWSIFFMQDKGKKNTLIKIFSLNEPVNTYIDFFYH
jgi:adenine specific DNA methylase Mod